MAWRQSTAAAILFATSTFAVGCAGGRFEADSALASTPVLPVTGKLGLNYIECEGEPVPVRDEPVEVGSFRGVVGAPHREFSSTKLFGESALEDYRRYIAEVRDGSAKRRVGDALAEVKPGGTTLGIPFVDDLLRGVAFVLALPSTATETTTFTILGEREDRVVLGACSTTDQVRVFGALEGPGFSMTCHFTSTADGAPRILRVTSSGSWVNFRFHGVLSGPDGERATFGSQNMEVAGVGVARGFELRGPSGQTAAVSFWELPRRTGPAKQEYDPAAWMLVDAPDGWTDVLYAALALSYAYRWPTACDAGRLRSKAMATMPAH